MVAGLDLVLRDKDNKIKEDIHIFRHPTEGKKVEKNTLKEKENKW